MNTGGWERLAYLFPPVNGYLIASDRRFETAMRRERRPALACALVATAALLAWAGVLHGPSLDAMTGAARGWGFLQGVAGWLWIGSILGFAGSLVDRRTWGSTVTDGSSPTNDQPRWRSAAKYANEAVLPFYVLHEPIIVATAWVIVRWNASILGKYVALVFVSFVGTLALYEVFVRRFRFARLMFGMKPPAMRGA